jgi:hypothetical protein
MQEGDRGGTGGGNDRTIELTLYLLVASDGKPHSLARSLTLYARNKDHAMKQAKPWIDEWSGTLPHLEVQACPNGFSVGMTTLPGRVQARLPENVGGCEVKP